MGQKLKNTKQIGIGVLAGLGLGAAALSNPNLTNVSSPQKSLEEKLSVISQPFAMNEQPNGHYLFINRTADPEELRRAINDIEDACLNPDGTYSCGTQARMHPAVDEKASPYVDVFVDTSFCDGNRTATRLGREGIYAQNIIEFKDGGEWSIKTPLTYHFSEEKADHLRSLERPFTEEIIEASREQGISPLALSALISIESNYDSNALGSSGEIGLGQIKPTTAMMFGVTEEELWKAEKNLFASVNYFSEQLSITGDAMFAAGGYNRGINGTRRTFEDGCEGAIHQFSDGARRHMEKFIQEYASLYENK